MNNKPLFKYPFFLSLRTKMVFSFSLIFITVIVVIKLVEFYGVPFTNFKGEEKGLREIMFKNIDLVADLKKERLKRWFEERMDNVEVIAKSSLVKNNIRGLGDAIQGYVAQGLKGEELGDTVGEEGLYADLSGYLKLVRGTHKVYNEIEIVDKDTYLNIATTRSSHLGRKMKGDIFTKISNPDDIYVDIITDPYKKKEGAFTLLIVGAISGFNPISNEKELTGAVVAYINPEDFMQPLLHTGGGLGKSGEVILVNEKRVILSSLKHPLKDGTKAHVLKYEITADPAVFAARGGEGLVISKDYRDVPVLAAFRHISLTPDLQWGMVVKRDLKEVFGFLRRSMAYTAIISLIFLIMAILAVIFVANMIMRPINVIKDTAQRVQDNDLTARADVKSSDEIGFLARSFNSMIGRVENWKEELEKTVQIRTGELKASNQQLKAGEQQLRASNQQLRAGEQQLRASNQQLKASEQQLRAEVDERKKIEEEREKHSHDLEIFYKANIGREERIVALKKKTKELEAKLGKKPDNE